MKELNTGPLDDQAIVRLFERVIDESRRLERIMTTGEGTEKGE
jgi:chorismate mutase